MSSKDLNLAGSINIGNRRVNGIEVTFKTSGGSPENQLWRTITAVMLITLGLCGVAIGIYLHIPLIFAAGILVSAIGGYLILPSETQDALDTISKAVTVAVALLALAPMVL